MSRFHRGIAAAMLLAASTGAVRAAEGDRVHLEVHETPVEGRKALDMRFDETARDDRSSTVDVTSVSGASVPSSMFVMRGMCAIARARDRASSTADPVPGQPGGHRVTFPSQEGTTTEIPAHDGRPARRVSNVITVEQCGLVGF